MTHFQAFAKQLAVGNLSITFPLILKEITIKNRFLERLAVFQSCY